MIQFDEYFSDGLKPYRCRWFGDLTKSPLWNWQVVVVWKSWQVQRTGHQRNQKLERSGWLTVAWHRYSSWCQVCFHFRENGWKWHAAIFSNVFWGWNKMFQRSAFRTRSYPGNISYSRSFNINPHAFLRRKGLISFKPIQTWWFKFPIHNQVDPCW